MIITLKLDEDLVYRVQNELEGLLHVAKAMARESEGETRNCALRKAAEIADVLTAVRKQCSEQLEPPPIETAERSTGSGRGDA